MNKNQRVFLQSTLWPNACAVQHWDPRDRALRLQVCGEALGRQLTTTSEIDERDEFTLVKNRLLKLADNLQGAREDGDLTAGHERTRRHKIRDQVKCIALYPLDAPRGQGGAENYVRAIIRDCHRAGYERPQFDTATLDTILESLKLRQLDNLVITLDARLHNKRTGMRVQAGHTLHDMKIEAGLDCGCAECRRFASEEHAEYPESDASDASLPDLEPVSNDDPY